MCVEKCSRAGTRLTFNLQIQVGVPFGLLTFPIIKVLLIIFNLFWPISVFEVIHSLVYLFFIKNNNFLFYDNPYVTFIIPFFDKSTNKIMLAVSFELDFFIDLLF